MTCSVGFRTGTIGNVPDAEKYAIEREYGMVARSYGRTIEIEHIVSLELGGSNVIANLFPERLHEMVCDGAMTLGAAQRSIASDWRALYRRVFGSAP